MKGLRYSIARSQSLKDVRVAHLTIDEVLSFTGVTDAAVGDGASMGALPEGNILFLGAVGKFTFTGEGSANLADDFQGDVSFGTVVTADNDLADSGEANILASTAIPAAESEVSANVRITNATQSIIDNTEGDQLLALNVLLDANEVTNGETVEVTVTGTLDFAYILLGDD